MIRAFIQTNRKHWKKIKHLTVKYKKLNINIFIFITRWDHPYSNFIRHGIYGTPFHPNNFLGIVHRELECVLEKEVQHNTRSGSGTASVVYWCVVLCMHLHCFISHSFLLCRCNVSSITKHAKTQLHHQSFLSFHVRTLAPSFLHFKNYTIVLHSNNNASNN